jgi:hypothetical protein
MASTYLSRTVGTATNNKKATFSFWIKRGTVTNRQMFVRIINPSSTAAYSYIEFDGTTDTLTYDDYGGSSTRITRSTSQVFRDVSAWYHIVIAVDTTQATGSDRAKVYVNGEQVTSFASTSDATQDYVLTGQTNGKTFYIGAAGDIPSLYFDGSMAHFHFIDGTAYDASAFGEYDANGVWKIKTSPSVTYGNNGFFILKDGNSVTDQSGNGNNFTVASGTLTNTEDSPSNVFATLNPLNSFYSGATFSNGNNRVSLTGGTYAAVSSTLGFNSGKWYAEFKAADATNWVQVGIVAQNPTASGQPLGYFSDSYGYIGGTAAGGVNSLMNNDSNTSYASTYGNGDIISVAVDCDNNKLYFGLNGTWLNSGNPESGATGTGAAFTISSSPTSGFYYFAVGNYSGSETPDWEANFGNGYFGTTAVASAGTNASGIGIFEYDVPTGYTALSTKGLNL